MNSACIWSFSGLYFPAFGLNTERYSVSFRIQSECGKIRTTKTQNTETFYVVAISPETLKLQREMIKKVYTRVQEKVKEIRQDFATAVQ